jgi:nitroreductase
MDGFPMTAGASRPAIVADVIRTRRTVGAFQPLLPPREIVLEALELACWAPNHHKTEPWRFHALGPETVARLIDWNTRLLAETKGVEAAEAKRRQWAAVPGWLLVTCLRSNDPVQAEEDFAACCCAVQNFLLSLWSHGIATKWSTGGITRQPEFLERLDLDPGQHRLVGLIWYGYPEKLPQQQRHPATVFLRELP